MSDIGANDMMPPPGVVEAEHLDRLHHLMSQNVLLMRDTLVIARRAGGAMGVATVLGVISTAAAVISGSGALTFQAAVMTAGCGALAAMTWAQVARMQQTLSWLEEGLTAWGAAEVQRRLG